MEGQMPEENEELLPNEDWVDSLLTNSQFEKSQSQKNSDSNSDGQVFKVKYVDATPEPTQNRLRYDLQKPHPPSSAFIRARSPAPIPDCITVLEGLEEDAILTSKAVTYHFSPIDTVFELLILVESDPSSRDWREALRETWKLAALHSGQKAHVVFLVPAKVADGVVNRSDLELESRTNEDMILFHNVSSSSIASGKLVHFLFFCHKIFQYHLLLRTHDFFYVRVTQLLNQLSEFRGHSYVYMGYFRGNASIGKEDSNQGDKWFLCPALVPHADHSAYVLSSQVVDRLLLDYEYRSYYDSEGGSVGLWLSPHKDIEFVHSVAFDSSARSRGCRNNFVLSPMDSIMSLRARHSRLMSGKPFCAKEIDFEPNYMYNWSALPSKCCEDFV